MARCTALAGLFVVCALVAFAATAKGSDIAAAASGYSSCKTGMVMYGGRCVHSRNPIVPFNVKIYAVVDGQEKTVNITTFPPPAVGWRTSTALLGLSNKSPLLTLPPGATMLRFVFHVDTSGLTPKHATGVRCLTSTDPAIAPVLVNFGNPDAALRAFYGATTSGCYKCTSTKQPKLTTVNGVVQPYAPLDCLARCNPYGSVGGYTVVLNQRVRRRTALAMGNAWMTVEGATADGLPRFCAYTFPGRYGQDWIYVPSW